MHVEVIPKQLVDGMESLDYHENMDSENVQHTHPMFQLSVVPLFVIVYQLLMKQLI